MERWVERACTSVFVPHFEHTLPEIRHHDFFRPHFPSRIVCFVHPFPGIRGSPRWSMACSLRGRRGGSERPSTSAYQADAGKLEPKRFVPAEEEMFE